MAQWALGGMAQTWEEGEWEKESELLIRRIGIRSRKSSDGGVWVKWVTRTGTFKLLGLSSGNDDGA